MYNIHVWGLIYCWFFVREEYCHTLVLSIFVCTCLYTSGVGNCTRKFVSCLFGLLNLMPTIIIILARIPLHFAYTCYCVEGVEMRQFVYTVYRSGNFRVKKLSYDKFSCKKIFVGTTPYCISVNSVH